MVGEVAEAVVVHVVACRVGVEVAAALLPVLPGRGRGRAHRQLAVDLPVKAKVTLH